MTLPMGGTGKRAPAHGCRPRTGQRQMQQATLLTVHIQPRLCHFAQHQNLGAANILQQQTRFRDTSFTAFADMPV